MGSFFGSRSAPPPAARRKEACKSVDKKSPPLIQTRSGNSLNASSHSAKRAAVVAKRSTSLRA
jgi:hypothetical protein